MGEGRSGSSLVGRLGSDLGSERSNLGGRGEIRKPFGWETGERFGWERGAIWMEAEGRSGSSLVGRGEQFGWERGGGEGSSEPVQLCLCSDFTRQIEMACSHNGRKYTSCLSCYCCDFKQYQNMILLTVYVTIKWVEKCTHLFKQ